MSNIDAAPDEKIDSTPELSRPIGNGIIDTRQAARAASNSSSKYVRKNNGLLDIDFCNSHGSTQPSIKGNGLLDINFCHSAFSTQPPSDKVDKLYDGHELNSARPASRAKPRDVKNVSQWIVDHQLGISVGLLLLLLLTHTFFPETRTHTRKFTQHSYYNPVTGQYALGPDDAYSVVYWIVVFTALRAAVMDYLLMPVSWKAGVKKARDQTRFCEQAWLLIYYSVFWTVGMFIWTTSDYWLNLKNMWTNFPNREISGLLKWYLLAQYAFWMQQFLVLHVEKPRKDHWQMFAHHIVTTLLIFCSYCYHQTRVANVVLCIMDVVDLFFPTAKCLKYAGYNLLCDIMFGLFMVVWVAARHVIFMMATYSVYAHSDTMSPPGCYRGEMGSITGPFPAPNKYGHLLEPFTNSEGLVCWTGPVKWGFVNSLLFLQVLTMIWFSMILKVAIKVLKGGQADDTRSDDENESEVEDEGIRSETEKEKNFEVTGHSDDAGRLEPLEEVVGVESLNLKSQRSPTYQRRQRKSASFASGASMADKKQLLDRIGCEKKISD